MQLSAYQVELLGFRLALRFQPADLLPQLCDALLELRLLSIPRISSALEQGSFASNDLGNVVLACAARQHARDFDGRSPIALGLETGLSDGQLIELTNKHPQVGARDGLVEPHHQIARLDLIAVAHPDLAND